MNNTNLSSQQLPEEFRNFLRFLASNPPRPLRTPHRLLERRDTRRLLERRSTHRVVKKKGLTQTQIDTIEEFEFTPKKEVPRLRTRNGIRRPIVNKPSAAIHSPDKVEPTSDITCSICQEDYIEKEMLRNLPCGHQFHKACADQSLLISRFCPLCRKEVVADEKPFYGRQTSPIIIEDDSPDVIVGTNKQIGSQLTPIVVEEDSSDEVFFIERNENSANRNC